MVESNRFELRFYEGSNKMVLEPNNLTKFSFFLKNIGESYLPLVFLDFIIPPSINLSKTRKGIGGVPKGSTRRIFLKIKGNQVGVFTFKVRISSKKQFIEEKEFIVQVGDVSEIPNLTLEHSPERMNLGIASDQNEENIRVCQKCGGKNKIDAAFCIFCGQDLKDQSNSKICPNCGEEKSHQAKFCGACGTKLN